MNRKTSAMALWSAVCLIMAVGVATPASAEQYFYKGHDATYPNIQMELYITKASGPGYDATGSIYVGNIRYQVKGTFSGTSLSATVAYPLQYSGTAARVPVTGSLSGGALGRSTLSASTGNVLISGKYYMLKFMLTPPATVPVPVPVPGPRPGPAPAPTVAQDFRGSASFGFTKVELLMHFQPNGTAYRVSGQATVHSVRPRDQTTVLRIAGAYSPGSVPARMTVTGAPPAPGTNPLLTCTLHGKTLNCQMTGMPALGITNLYITAKAP